jgi:hypothetical protein
MKATAIAQLAYDAGIRDRVALAKAVAIALAESGGNENAVGDVGLQNAQWGPSLGLWQIRSLKAESGKGTVRDATRLKDPAFNAKSMFSISNSGKDWGPWTTWPLKAAAFMPIATPVASAVVDAGKVSGAVDAGKEAVAGVTDGLADVGTGVRATYEWISDRNNWMRIGKAGIGIALVVGGILVVAVPRVADALPIGKAAKIAKGALS